MGCIKSTLVKMKMAFMIFSNHWNRGNWGKKDPSGCSNSQWRFFHVATSISNITRQARVFPSSTNG